MNFDFISLLDAAVVICFAISFIGFKFIPTKRHVLCNPDSKDIELLKFGSIFFGLGLLLFALQFIVGRSRYAAEKKLK